MASPLVAFGVGKDCPAGGRLYAQTQSSGTSTKCFTLTGRHRNSCRFRLSSSLDHSLLSKRKVAVRVTADYSDSKPESSKRNGKRGYHPLEDLAKAEREDVDHAPELTTAEVARTVSEVNWSAFIFSSVFTGKDAVLGTEVQYLVDDHGDFYFEIENDNEFLGNLLSSQIYTVLVGFGSVEGLQVSEVIEAEVEEGQSESDSEDDSSDDTENTDVEIYWEAADELEALDDSLEESFGSLGGWGGYESLDQVHPMDFATKVAESVSADHIADIDKPARRLTITGVARPVTEEEEPYVQGIWYDRFLLSGNEDEVDDLKQKHDNGDPGPGAQSSLTKVTQDAESIPDQKTYMTDADQSKMPEGSENGWAFDMQPGGTDGSDEDDVNERNRSKSIDADLSSGDPSMSESESAPEESDALREGHKERSDSDDESVVSREVGSKRNRRSKRRGIFLDSSDGQDDGLEVEEASEIVLPPGATLEGEPVSGERTERSTKSSQAGSCFYKLEILSIQLDCGAGVQSTVEVRDFAYAEPDALAHFSSTVMDRVIKGGKKAENALKALCQRTKGLIVEEASVVGVDCLGLDLRVRCGIEVQTVRIPFRRRATCKETANKQIDQLLFPRNGQRRSRKKGHDSNSP